MDRQIGGHGGGPMHVIVITTAGMASGGVRQALYLVDGLKRLGHTVHFVCRKDCEPGLIGAGMGIEPVALPDSLRAAEKTLRALMPGDKPTIVHAFHNRGVKLAAYLGTYWRLLRLPVACVAHRGVTSRPGNPLPYLLPGIRAYLVNSVACAATLPLLWRRGRCHLVNNSIPENRITPLRSRQEMRLALNIPAGDAIIGNVCSDNPLKGAGQSIKAFALAKGSLPPAKLLVVGVTPEKWRPLCEELGVAGDVLLVPRASHVADYMQLLDILIFPSIFIESQPNVILEAMSMGLPIIAGDVGGVRELLPPECLFDAKNEREISARLIELLRRPEELRRLGKENALQKDNFSTERRLRLILGHYRQALSELPGADSSVKNS